MRRFKFLSVLVLMIVWLAAGSASAREQINKESSKDSESKEVKKNKKFYKDAFYEIARLIMTKEEINIYKHLPDKKAKEKFIEEFWNKRDPSPGTEENESREEFYLRIAYANKWFKEGTRGKGWDTERGRILLQLGFPDKREFSDYTPTYKGRLLTTKRARMEVWAYYRYQLVLYFIDANDSGRLRLTRIPSNLSYALDREKFTLNLTSKSDEKQDFKFDVDYKSDHFQITIPIKKVSFEEKNDNQMIVDFGITVYVYKNNEKFDEISQPKTVSMEKEKLLEMKTIDFNIPYTVSEKGKYFFDVIIEEKSTASKFRDYARYKK